MQVAAASNTLKSISLKNTTGNRNAEYHCQLVHVGGDGYQVNYQYGRIGSALRPGSKPAAPVSLEKAEKVYDKIVTEKKSEGYLEEGAPDSPGSFAGSDDAGTIFQQPQLLNEITREEAMRLISDGNWVMQPKEDGKRIQVEFNEDETKISNKLAKACSIPGVIVDQLKALDELDGVLSPNVRALHVDAELIGNSLHIFDLLKINGDDLRDQAFELREETYRRLIEGNKSKSSADTDEYPNLVAVPTYFHAFEKRAAFERIEAEHGEGVVFKLRYERYTPGRPNSGGPALKFKFRERSTCICLGASDGKRSIRLGLLDADGAIVEVGNVTVPPNLDVPSLNDLVEVEYLYKYEGGSLFQPVLKGVRDDVLREECTLAQVKRIKAKEAGHE